MQIHSFIHFWHVPLGVCFATLREWTILSHFNRFIQREVVGFKVLLDSLRACSTRASRWTSPVLQGEVAEIFLASVSSGIHAVWQNWEKGCAWTIAKSCGYPVVCLTSSWWYHLICNSFHRHHWLRASVLRASIACMIINIATVSWLWWLMLWVMLNGKFM